MNPRTCITAAAAGLVIGLAAGNALFSRAELPPALAPVRDAEEEGPVSRVPVTLYELRVPAPEQRGTAVLPDGAFSRLGGGPGARSAGGVSDPFWAMRRQAFAPPAAPRTEAADLIATDGAEKDRGRAEGWGWLAEEVWGGAADAAGAPLGGRAAGAGRPPAERRGGSAWSPGTDYLTDGGEASGARERRDGGISGWRELTDAILAPDAAARDAAGTGGGWDPFASPDRRGPQSAFARPGAQGTAPASGDGPDGATERPAEQRSRANRAVPLRDDVKMLEW
ncbi:MAG: hypothetical protein FJ225_00425 [Lentisphaerae bacterium]|nr:hypothetical protein [Lentisphaerota bacterium]